MVNEAKKRYLKNLTQVTSGMQYGATERIDLLQRLLAACGQPDMKYPIIHICGTNGKGSTGLMIAKLLQATGLTVGSFTSPAINDDREMIQIDQRMISYEAFNAAFLQVAQGLQTLNLPLESLSIFELWFMVALLYFAQASVDAVVLECGLGGEFDATNAITTAAYDVFTHIDYDHMALLGDDIESIALTKARIIRTDAQVIDYPNQYLAVSQIIQQQAQQKAATYHNSLEITLTTTHSDLHGSDLLWQAQPLHLGLVGSVQVQNLRTVLAFVKVYNQQPFGSVISREMIEQTLAQLKFIGRWQQLQTQPPIYLDGGHNPDALKNVATLLKSEAAQFQLILVLGFLKDKNVAENLRLLKDLAADVITTTPDQPQRAMVAAELTQLVQENWTKAKSVQTAVLPEIALRRAKAMAQQYEQPLIFIGGSFYLVKAVLATDD
ncbi:bifunctional folylpolyglutamate synthase/dihydrofolate synthase [Agrilactobacillus yilanensis]|uniref:tetrahydrofolate synthase n=1 Tax=Agrilactobacillus yilanensis TaxID=2485997 RepID=A0ABW4J764_9LACO|nr:cyanophycin synthetase [Agrilactobacillus yilanensis]